jgi:hypothetical protein
MPSFTLTPDLVMEHIIYYNTIVVLNKEHSNKENLSQGLSKMSELQLCKAKPLLKRKVSAIAQSSCIGNSNSGLRSFSFF